MMNCTQCGITCANRWNLIRHANHCHINPTSTGSPHNAEFSQVDEQLHQGVKRKIDSEEAISDEESNDGSEMSVRGADTRNESDIFTDTQAEYNDHEDAYISSSHNSSSDDSDSCGSSTDYSSGVDDEALSADVSLGEDDVSCDEEDVEGKLHNNYARWRAPESGVYSLWISRSRKPYVARHRKWLRSLLNCKVRRSLIRKSTDSQMEAISEVAANVLDGGAVMTMKHFDFVRENRALISLMASERITYSQLRRSLLVPEQGHVLPLLLLFATPLCLKSRKKTVCKSDYKSNEADEPIGN